MDDLISRISKRSPDEQDILKLNSQEVLGDFVTTKKHVDEDPIGLLSSLVGSGQFLHSVPAGVVLQNASGRLIDCNDQAADLLGYARDDLIAHGAGFPGWDCVREDGSIFPEKEQPANITLRTGDECSNVVMGTNNQAQSRRWVSVNTFPVDLEDGTKGVISSFVEVTTQLKKDRSLKLLTEVNRVMMFAHDQASCFQELCRVLVEQGNYALAWIAVISNGQDGGEEGGANIACAAGATDYLYEDNAAWWGSKASGMGPPGIAIRTGQTQVVNDLANNAWSEQFKLRAAKYELGSLICIPFDFGERGATLNVYDRNLFNFDDATVKGLEEIVKEAEFGISHVRSVQQTEVALEETTEAINALRATELARAEAEERFRLAFENNMAPMLTSDLFGYLTAANKAFCDMLGMAMEELIGFNTSAYTFPEDMGMTEENLKRLISGEVDEVRYIKRYIRKDGRVIFVEVSTSPVKDAAGRILYVVVSQRDITEERKLTDQLSHQALHDPLTGLANRALFEDRLSVAHRRAARFGDRGAVLLVDLDDFKGVNDTYGHLVGDQLLMAVARRLELVTRSSDTLCRFGGDEFLYLAESVKSEKEAEQVAARLLEALVEPFVIEGVHIDQHASVGVVVWGEASLGYNEIVQEADLALYEAKREGKGHHVVFTPGMHQQAKNRFALINDLRRALVAGQISMHYQPIIDLRTTGVVGFEALMRWQHPERGPVSPDVFIPLAEQSDLILELGAFALHEAVIAAGRWSSSSAKNAGPYVTVNLSAHQFRDPNLVKMIGDELRASSLAPGRLIIEITESVTLLYVAETLSVMEELNAMGVGFALDDFGTGYSSLSYLALTHPKIIKIDQSFVSPAIESLRNDTLLEAIVSLGQKLDMTMLAEGIETPAQLERLQRLGCELGQGFLFSPALPANLAALMVNQTFTPALLQSL
jgi:diguanylate cyclase (GGDEF)-like protein/PAS domain S-box-containing protein